jgi:hypothetical protein
MLALIVSLYDPFRPYYLARFAPVEEPKRTDRIAPSTLP